MGWGRGGPRSWLAVGGCPSHVLLWNDCVCVCHSPEHQVAWGCTYVSVAGWCFVDCPVGIAVMSLCITTTLQYTDI